MAKFDCRKASIDFINKTLPAEQNEFEIWLNEKQTKDFIDRIQGHPRQHLVLVVIQLSYQIAIKSRSREEQALSKAEQALSCAEKGLLLSRDILNEYEDYIEKQENERQLKKTNWANIRRKGSEKSKLRKINKQQLLQSEIKELMGSDTGMKAKEIVRAIESKCSVNNIAPPYSAKAGKDGKSSLLRNIETLLPEIRQEIRNSRPPKNQA
jgi:hypothetical protein